MGFCRIDYDTWPRRPYFEHYHRDVPCWYSMTADVDITALLPRLRESGLRFYPAIIYGIARMVNADPALRTAMDGTGALQHLCRALDLVPQPAPGAAGGQ